MPTPTDQQLAEDIQEVAENLAGFRVEVAEKFGTGNANLEGMRGERAEKFGAVNANLEGFRSAVETNLKIIRWLGMFFASLLVALFVGSLTVAWNASALNSDVKEIGRRLNDLTSAVEQRGARLNDLTIEVKH